MSDARRIAGFTLIEILVAMFIFALVVPTIYGAYRATLRVTSDAEYSDEAYSIGRSAMDRFIKDLESVCAYKDGYQFSLRQEAGGTDQAVPTLTFTSSAHINFSGRSEASGIATITYTVEKGPDGGYTLMRKDTLMGGSQAEAAAAAFAVCEKIKSIALKFYDSKGQEFDTWDSSSDMNGQNKKAPSAVSIDLQLVDPNSTEAIGEIDGKPSPYRFVTRIKVGAA